jgi:hypothetical protein
VTVLNVNQSDESNVSVVWENDNRPLPPSPSATVFVPCGSADSLTRIVSTLSAPGAAGSQPDTTVHSATFVLPSVSATTTAGCGCEKTRTFTVGTWTPEKSPTSNDAGV